MQTLHSIVIVGGGFAGTTLTRALDGRRFVGLQVTLVSDGFSGLPAWLLWRAYYLSQMPTLRRKLRISVEWTWGMFFPADITTCASRAAPNCRCKSAASGCEMDHARLHVVRLNAAVRAQRVAVGHGCAGALG